MGLSFEECKSLSDITGVNRYNPTQVKQLEMAVELMIKETKYDKDILMTLLKLYQLNPNLYDEKYVLLVLLKTMTNFPRNDFALAKYLLEANKVNTPDMKRVMAVGAMLESCNFSLFWKLVNGRYRPSEREDEPYKRPDEIKAVVESINGFKEAVRNYACQVINVTFQRIYKHQLVTLLGDIDDKELASYTTFHKWKKLEDEGGQGLYFIQNHEATIKSRNIEERLRFDQYIDVLRQAA